MSGPLSGIRILEVGHMLAGPYCGLLLGDLGAEIIKIEPPEGDIARGIGPHYVGRHNVYFASLNRNKHSVCLDLTQTEGRATFNKLCLNAQALIVNLRPAAIKKLGLTYEALKSINPQLVCVALTGYGLDGPMADQPAYDYVIQALTGVMALTGEPGGPPTKTGFSAVDNAAGTVAALGLLSKIIEGKGGQVDVAMYDVMLSQLNYIAAAWLNAGHPAQRQPASSHPYIVPAQLFRTKDDWICLFITHDNFWRRFATEVGRPEWLEDPAFATMSARRANRAIVISAIEEVLKAETVETWLKRLVPLGLVVSDIKTLEQSLSSEHAQRRMVCTIETQEGIIQSIGNPIRIDDYAQPTMPPPLLGEHNGMVLSADWPAR